MQRTKNNKLNLLVAAFILMISYSSCDSDFAKKDYVPYLYSSQDTIFLSPDTDFIEANFNVNISDKAWRVVDYPSFIEPRFTSGFLKGSSSITLPLSVNHDEFTHGCGIYNLEIVFDVNGLGLVKFPIQYFSYGSPTINVTPNQLNLRDDAHGEFSISNSSEGILLWEITSTPEWMRVEKLSDVVEPYSQSQINYSVNPENLKSGDYTGNIVIHNNVGNNILMPVILTVSEYHSANSYQEGELVGSVFLSKTNQVIAVCKNPNRILTFIHGDSDPIIDELDRVPCSVALSEDEKTLAIGFSNTQISTYDANSKTLKNTYKLEDVPMDIEFGSVNYLYYLSSVNFNGDYKYLNSLNLTSGETIKSRSYEGGIKTLKKVPNKNILITTKTGWDPEYLILYYNTDQGTVEDKNSYCFTPHGLWSSDCGQYLVTGQKVVYEVPEFDPESAVTDLCIDHIPAVVGQFELDGSSYVNAVYKQSSSNLLYVAYGDSYFSSKTYVHIFNFSTFVRERRMEFASNPPFDHPQGNTWWEKTRGIYPFNDGTKIWLIQEYPGNSFSSPDLWGIRLLEL